MGQGICENNVDKIICKLKEKHLLDFIDYVFLVNNYETINDNNEKKRVYRVGDYIVKFFVLSEESAWNIENECLAIIQGEPYAPELVSSGTIPGVRSYIVTKYIDGVPYSNKDYKQHKKEIDDVIKRLREDKNIDYPDDKPEHFIVTKSGLKIIDFDSCNIL